MNGICSHILKTICSNSFTQVRYIREMPWKNTYLRRFGYKDPFFKRPDTLPRIKETDKKSKIGLSHLPEYKPKNQWSEKRKYFGQNDYIDILGDGSIHPVKLLTNMPLWLRGFQGNEFQMLLAKQRAYAHWRWSKPTKWKHLNKRIMYLYRYLNSKTKT
ncbi:39S ribosomal protein L51, mitochondrial-like [Uloborus diversus]|uniref:39S ribosomal protein L51, mitochondrial-like n=1 Tax=Uloborus diversus TaxID=327109 RepID=UPI002409D948|nr:39S ribosomal protein L51, mitochondrial-like [Uloborus diversus]